MNILMKIYGIEKQNNIKIIYYYLKENIKMEKDGKEKNIKIIY